MNTTKKLSSSDRILSRAQFREMANLGRTREWQMEREGMLPPMVVVGNRRLGYLESRVQEWFEANLSKAPQQ